VQNPLHPYAKGLMGRESPTLSGEDKRLVQIPGSMPAAVGDPRRAARFNTRAAHSTFRSLPRRPA